MTDFFNNFFKLLTDRTISFSRRTSFLLFIILLILLANDTFNFSFNYRINQKIEQYKSIYSLYPASSVDTANVKKTLSDLENEIKHRRPFISKIKKIYSGIVDGELTASQKIFLWKLFSANIIFVILALIFPIIERDKEDLKNIYLGMICVVFVLNFLFFLIPTFDNIIYNHLIHLGTEVILFIVAAIFGQKKRT